MTRNQKIKSPARSHFYYVNYVLFANLLFAILSHFTFHIIHHTTHDSTSYELWFVSAWSWTRRPSALLEFGIINWINCKSQVTGCIFQQSCRCRLVFTFYVFTLFVRVNSRLALPLKIGCWAQTSSWVGFATVQLSWAVPATSYWLETGVWLHCYMLRVTCYMNNQQSHERWKLFQSAISNDTVQIFFADSFEVGLDLFHDV
jgi:hypothetical protein